MSKLKEGEGNLRVSTKLKIEEILGVDKIKIENSTGRLLAG